jgi:cytochrome c553
VLKRVLRWLGIGLGTILVLALVALVYAYVASSRIIDRTYDVPLIAFEIPSDSALLGDGPRLASLWGCLGGCHGEEGGGTLMFEQLLIGRIRAPNITTILPDYTDAELERLIRRGVKRDGRSAFVMPSRFLYHLDDTQLGAIIAHVRSLPQKKDQFKGGVKLGPIGRVFLALGEFQSSAEEVDADSPRSAYPDPNDELGLGRFWATIGCSECHGDDLRGGDDGFAPSLEVVATSYTPADFELLMRTGIAIGGRKPGLMSEVARANFRHFTRREVAGLYTHLKSHFATDTAAAE